MNLAAIELPVGTLLTYLLTALGIACAIFIAGRSERQSQRAKSDAAAARVIAEADKARTEYVEMLEGQIQILKGRVDECDKKSDVFSEEIRKLKAAESICQEERNRLLQSYSWLVAENAQLRQRLGDKLEPKAT